jgi:O-antigen ligase
MAGLSEHFFWGSGFGGVADVVRSDERPWTFELTYSRLLFNGGLIGFGLLMLFYLAYLILALRKIRQSFHAPIYISLLTGFLSVSIASVSNPYMSSFDFLFVLSIIPLILNSKDQPRTKHMHEWVQT